MNSDRKKIVVVGSTNMDLVAYTSRIPVEGETITGKTFTSHPGGKGANQAVAAARLGWPVQMIGRVGDDSFGQDLRQHLRDAGVDDSTVLTSDGSSGVAVILVSDSGENCIVVTPGANALVSPADLDAHLSTLQNAGIVLAQLEIPLETIEHLAQICGREGVPLVLDPAPARELPESLLRRSTWFTPNETEAAFFVKNDAGTSPNSSDIADALVRSGVQNVVLKMGEKGAFLKSAGGTDTPIAPFKVKAIDTTAAGDAFNGAFATALLMGRSPVESARFASAAAALSVTKAGAQSSMPLFAEVEEMLAHGSQP